MKILKTLIQGFVTQRLVEISLLCFVIKSLIGRFSIIVLQVCIMYLLYITNINGKTPVKKMIGRNWTADFVIIILAYKV